MIKINNLSKSYGDVQAVKSINFKLNDGEVVGFLGANGAGKSTTLKMITGYLTPSAGKVYVNDKNIIDEIKNFPYLKEILPRLFYLYLKFYYSIMKEYLLTAN